ncbi:hypothetical protein [Flavobacterium sp.]
MSESGTPVSENGTPVFENGTPVFENGAPVSENGAPVSAKVTQGWKVVNLWKKISLPNITYICYNLINSVHGRVYFGI